MKHIAAFFFCFCLCAPTLAAPSSTPPAAPTAAEQAYSAQFIAHTRKMGVFFAKVGSLFKSPQYSDAVWKHKLAVTAGEMGKEAAQGCVLHAPPRFHAVQQAYAAAMVREENFSHGIPAAVAAGDKNAGERCFEELKQGILGTQRAAVLFQSMQPNFGAVSHTASGGASTLSAAEQAYAIRFMGHLQKIGGLLRKVGVLFQPAQAHVGGWQQKLTATLEQIRVVAQAGQKLTAPPRFRSVQSQYTSGMVSLADVGRGLPAAIRAQDKTAGARYAAETRQGMIAMQRAAVLFRSNVQPKAP